MMRMCHSLTSAELKGRTLPPVPRSVTVWSAPSHPDPKTSCDRTRWPQRTGSWIVLRPRDLGQAPGWGGAFRKGGPASGGAWAGRGLSGRGLYVLKVSRLPGLAKQSGQLFPPQPCPGLRSYHSCPFCFCYFHTRVPEQPLRPRREHPPKAQPPAR